MTSSITSWTTEQKAIINPVTWGNTLVIACAGSGKSTTIVQRAIEQINSISPWKSVALISFTKKSAEDLKRKLTGNQSSQIYVTTFHAFLISEILCFDDLFRGKKYGMMYSREVDNIGEWYTVIATEKIIPVARSEKYKPKKDDFIFEYALGMLNNKVVRDYLKAKYHAIYIDEAQDNNGLQYDIVNQLIELGIECVLIGDPNQTIFSFRGAEPARLEALKQDAKFVNNVFHLTKNFRCHPIIDKWANLYCIPQESEITPVEKTNFGVFIYSKEIDKLVQENTILNEGIAILRYSLKDWSMPRGFEDAVKVIKEPLLLDQVQEKSRVSSLYKLILNGKNYNEFHYFDDECFDSNDKKLITLLRKFKENPIDVRLHELNSYFPILESDKIPEFIHSLNDTSIKSYYSHHENDRLAMTIHSAKGLEFNNVAVYKNDFKNLSNPEIQRLFYVAFTRARKRLFLL